MSGFSMQVVVPEGIHFRGEAIAAPRCTDFNITTQANADSTLITITGTMTGEPLAADNAPFIYLPIKSGREIRNYVIQLRNLQFTTVSTLFGTVNLPATSVTMHVLNIGDVNGDKVVDVADVNALTNLALGNGEDVPYPEVGDLDGNGIYDVSDINALINLILGND